MLRTTCPDLPKGGTSCPSNVRATPPALPTVSVNSLFADHSRAWPGCSRNCLGRWPSIVRLSHASSFACICSWWGDVLRGCGGCRAERTTGDFPWGAAAVGSAWEATAPGGDTAGEGAAGCDWPASAEGAKRAGEETGDGVPDSGVGPVAD